MSGIIYLVIHIIIYSSVGVLLYGLRLRLSLIPFYLYLGALEVLVSRLNSIYILEIDLFGWVVSLAGGNIVYSALIWCVLFLYIMERDPVHIKFVIYCLIAVQILFFALYPLIYIVLEDPLTVNPLMIPSDLFKTSFWIFIVGNCLQLVELFGMVILLEKASKITISSNKTFPWQFWSVSVYISVLLLDGIFFPLLAFPVTRSISVVQGIEAIIGKFFLGISFSCVLLVVTLFLTVEFTEKVGKTETNVLELISLPKAEMARKLQTSEENQALIRLLLYLLSHDIRNYNVTTAAYTDLLMKDNAIQGESSRKYLETIKRIQLESQALVDSVLGFNKVKEGILRPEKVKLEEMFESAVSKAMKTYPAIPLVIQNEKSLDDRQVLVHPLLTEVFYNLLINAIKHRKKDQKKVIIDLDVKEEEKNIQLAIGDRGKGIPDERKEEIFKQLSKAPYRKGIGLYIVKTILQHFKCDIRVENRPESPRDFERGSIFRLTLKKA
ncbi:MAG: sensor histidine kinase [Candidatus Odinarchaeota archaeon]